MSLDIATVSREGLLQFQELRSDAANAVTERFYAEHGADYRPFGDRGRAYCREDLAYHLEFLRPVLEFGLIAPMVDYLRWLAGVLAARDVPAGHLSLSLDWLAEFFGAHMDRAQAHVVVDALMKVKARFLETDDGHPAIYRMMPEAWPESAAFESALLAGNRRAAGAILDECLQNGRGLVEAEMHLIQPALYGVGKKWQDNEVTIAQEHLATAISQSLMTIALVKTEIPPSNGCRVLLACVEGNNHSVGLQMVADAFQLKGWEVEFLGANVPTAALMRHLPRFKPDLLGLSVSFAQQLHVVKDIMARLAAAGSAVRPAVIIGGLAINQFDRLAGQLGADAWSADAFSAVALASKFAVRPAHG